MSDGTMYTRAPTAHAWRQCGREAGREPPLCCYSIWGSIQIEPARIGLKLMSRSPFNFIDPVSWEKMFNSPEYVCVSNHSLRFGLGLMSGSPFIFGDPVSWEKMFYSPEYVCIFNHSRRLHRLRPIFVLWFLLAIFLLHYLLFDAPDPNIFYFIASSYNFQIIQLNSPNTLGMILS